MKANVAEQFAEVAQLS